MSDDIVARLRVLNHHAKKLAENESLDDLYRDALTRCEDLTLEAAAEIKRLRKEVKDLEKWKMEVMREAINSLPWIPTCKEAKP